MGPVDVLEGQLERLGPGPRCLALNISRRPSWGEEEELAPPWPRLRVLQGVLPRLRPARAPTRAGGAELRDCECEHSEGATTFSEDARDNETWHTVATVKWPPGLPALCITCSAWVAPDDVPETHVGLRLLACVRERRSCWNVLPSCCVVHIEAELWHQLAAMPEAQLSSDEVESAQEWSSLEWRNDHLKHYYHCLEEAQPLIG